MIDYSQIIRNFVAVAEYITYLNQIYSNHAKVKRCSYLSV